LLFHFTAADKGRSWAEVRLIGCYIRERIGGIAPMQL